VAYQFYPNALLPMKSDSAAAEKKMLPRFSNGPVGVAGSLIRDIFVINSQPIVKGWLFVLGLPFNKGEKEGFSQ
jgi:hypothetical protein